MPTKPSRNLGREKFWRQAIARQLESGLSQRSFCLQEGLNTNTFSTWKKVIRKRDSERTGVKAERKQLGAPESERPTFVPIAIAEVTATPTPAASPVVAELHPSGLVCILSGADLNTLRSLLTALRECRR